MTDFLAWGADFLNEMSDEHASFEVEISWTDNSVSMSETIIANVVDEEGNMVRGDVKARIENTRFMFNNADVIEHAIPLKRGVRITWDDSIYEIVIQGNKSYFFNDAYKRKVVVVTKHVLN